MSWTSDPKGCGKCDSCGMDMDLEPFCVNKPTLDFAAKQFGKTFPYGLYINQARLICKGDEWTERKPRS